MNKEQIPCCFSEVNTLGKHITNCTNLSTKLDKDNVQIRYFCEEHMIKVEKIRRKMAQKYINEYKEKLIEYCKRCDYQFSNSWYTQKYDDNICTDCFAEEGEWNEELEYGEFD
ncbi:hypothetical protein [Spiroplasma endosymbiont of Dasysyrphus albostriatus]|uniref:hypothetical protein n=1 Tax=Spiroplasma endosymbiont of Dasysyrphus albostriatus TaxID=3066299 RepID=UPI0030CB51C2